MRASGIVAVVGLVGITGCATSSAAGGHEAAGVGMAQNEGLRVDLTRIVDAHVHPFVPIHTTLAGDVISIRYAHADAGGALANLDAKSLTPMPPEAQVPPERLSVPSEQTVRVALEGGRFVECFRRRDIDQGYRWMAQAWTAHGLRIGLPVPISPGEASVMTEPQLVSVDGHRVVATFVATSAERNELLAVSLEFRNEPTWVGGTPALRARAAANP
jgi:hypothetical protein